MTLTLRQLLDAWGTPQGGSFEPDALVGRVCTDSRQLQPGDFFVPLVGERFDGHHFLAQLPEHCLLYTSPSPRDLSTSRMPSSA